MTAPVTLAFSGDQHEHLKSFLFPGDGNEAVAIALCGRREATATSSRRSGNSRDSVRGLFGKDPYAGNVVPGLYC